MKKMNKVKLISFCILTIIISTISALSVMIYSYAHARVDYTIEFTKNTKVKTIEVNINTLPLGRLLDGILYLDDDGYLCSSEDGAKLEYTASIADDVYVSYEYDEEKEISSQTEEDMKVYREGELLSVDKYSVTYLEDKMDTIKASLNYGIIPIFIVCLFVTAGLLYVMFRFYSKLMKEEIKFYDILIAMVALFVLYLFTYYVISLFLRKCIVIIPIALLLLGIYSIYKMKDKNYQNIYAAFIVVAGITMIFAMAPFNVPDEASHFLRAYKDSEFSGKVPDSGYWKFPKTLTDLTFKFTKSLHDEGNKFYAENYIAEVFNVQDYSIMSRGVTNISNVKNLSFVTYIPSATVCFIGRLVKMPVFVVFLLCRLVNLMLVAMCSYFALKIIPKFKKPLLIVTLFPLFIQQGAAINQDYITNSVIMLIFAFVMFLRYEAKKVGKKELLVLLALSVVLGLCKFGYFPVLLMLLIVPKEKFKNRKVEWVIKFAFMFIVLAISFAMNLSATSDSMSDTSVYGIGYLFSNPVDSISIIVNTIFGRLDLDLFRGFIDGYGYSTIYSKSVLSTTMYFMYFLFIFIADKEDDEKLGLFNRLVLIAIPLMVMGIVYLIAFTQWTEIGNRVIWGLQARYFASVTPFAYVAVSNNKLNLEVKNKKMLYSSIIGVAFSIAFFTIIGFFS